MIDLSRARAGDSVIITLTKEVANAVSDPNRSVCWFPKESVIALTKRPIAKGDSVTFGQSNILYTIVAVDGELAWIKGRDSDGDNNAHHTVTAKYLNHADPS